MMVPITALIAATTKRTDQAQAERRQGLRGRHRTPRNPSQPPAIERKTTAASGMRTITLR